MVAPDRQGEGLGRLLLVHAERLAPEHADRFGLFTGAGSTRNLAMYERAGYHRVGTDDGLVHLEKVRQEGRTGRP
jgi:GNAT superfamily N-acetyltransferase